MTDQAGMADSGEWEADAGRTDAARSDAARSDAARSDIEHCPNGPAMEETARNLEAILKAYNGSLDQRTELDQVIGRMYDGASNDMGGITRSLPKGNAPGG